MDKDRVMGKSVRMSESTMVIGRRPSVVRVC